MARLAALVPKPRVHLTRYHGVFAPHSRWRAEVTPAGRGKAAPTDPAGAAPGDELGAMTQGFQSASGKAGNEYAAWAVRGGDVGMVPAPATVWLLGTGLAGLGGRRWLRRKATGSRH